MANNRTIAVAEEHYQLGSSLLEQKNYLEAHTSLTKAVILNPSHANAHQLRGKTNLILENHDQAISDFEAAINHAADNIDIIANAHYHLGITYYDSEQYEAAIKHFRLALELTPKDHAAYYCRGTAQMKRHEPRAAIKDFQQAISLKPDYYQAHINLGIAYSHLDNPSKAIECFTAAIRVRPNSNRAYYYRGLAHYENKNLRNAIDDITLAIINEPEIHNPDYNKELTLETITELPNDLAIPLLLTCLDESKPLGSIFWQKRGLITPSLNRGTLKTIVEELKNRGQDVTTHHITVQKNDCSWLSFFKPSPACKPSMNPVCDDNLFRL